MQFHHITHPHPFRPQADLSKFFVIAVISNPVMFMRRYELYWRFKEMCDAAQVRLITVEQAFGFRSFMVTEPCNPMHVQVRTVEELWHKENAINLGVQRAAEHGAREVAWVDADCRPSCPARELFEKTWHGLQHYEFVQMWEFMVDLDLDDNAIGGPQPSFMANYVKYGSPNVDQMQALESDNRAKCYPYGSKLFGRPGLAWAANVDAFSKVGGLIDYSILGAGDWYMAYGLVGAIGATSAQHFSPAHAKKLYAWQDRAEHWIKRDVGYISGTMFHDWHGPKVARGYGTRGSILFDNEYDPDIDVKYDAQGLLQLETVTPRQIKMRDQIRAYFRSRNEDATR